LTISSVFIFAIDCWGINQNAFDVGGTFKEFGELTSDRQNDRQNIQDIGYQYSKGIPPGSQKRNDVKSF